MAIEMNSPLFTKIHHLGKDPDSLLRAKEFNTAEEAQKFVRENPRWICAAGWVKEKETWRVYYW